MRTFFCAWRMPAILAALCAALAASVAISLPTRAGSEPQNHRLRGTAPDGIVVTRPRSIRPSRRDPRKYLTTTDEIAALEAVHVALSSVADGSTYVWRRNHGLLNAVIRPTQSFKDNQERVCRHLVIMLNSGTYSRRAEGIACRHKDGSWSLDG